MNALGVSIWETGLAVCKATKLANEGYQVEFKYAKLLDATDAGEVAAALTGSGLASGVNSLFISWEPTSPDKQACWHALRAAVKSACPGAQLTKLTFDQRGEAVKAALGRDIKLEALQQVAGSSSSASWYEAQRFGTALNRQLFSQQTRLMREAAKAFLSSDRCSNSSEAYRAYVLGLGRSSGGWFFEEALWMAMYGTACHISSSSSSWFHAAAADKARRQQQQQQKEKARQQQQQARQQQKRERARERRERMRQQQDDQARQQRKAAAAPAGTTAGAGVQAAAAAAELSAAEPDVKAMSEVELRVFIEKLGASALVSHLDSAAAAAAAASSRSSLAKLLQLAQQCFPLWEAKRLVQCSTCMCSARATAATREAVARMMFRLEWSNSGCSSSSLQAREVRRRYRALALKVHPDKMPQEVQQVGGSQQLFTEAFKALQQAHELLMHCCG